MTCGCVRVDTDCNEPLDQLLRFIMPSVPKLPYEVAKDMLRQAYIEFARKTSLLTSHYRLPIQRGVRDYYLEAPEGYHIFGVMNLAGQHGRYLRFPNVDSWFFSWGYRFRLVSNNYIVFEDAPSRDELERTIALHLLPQLCVETIPTEITIPFGEGIAAGALARAYDMPNKDWTDHRLAEKKSRDFNRAILSGRNLHLTQFGSVAPSLQPLRIL